MNILQRINAVRNEVAYIRKDKRVENYMAVTHDAVTAEVRPSLITHGVVIVPQEISSEMVDSGSVTAKGGRWMRFEAKYSIKFINIDDPSDFISVELTSHALDYGDKAPGKALSYATKYAILKLLNIETGEDEEGRPEQKKPASSKSVARATLEEYNPEEQKFLKGLAMDVLSNLPDELAMFHAYEKTKKTLDSDEQVAWWAFFDSKSRAALKRAKDAERKESQQQEQT